MCVYIYIYIYEAWSRQSTDYPGSASGGRPPGKEDSDGRHAT